ncbi:MAG: hypothetical protein AAF291_09315 [Pseudomonadota bacterium]
MVTIKVPFAALAALALVTGCGPTDGIDTSGAVYSGVSPDAAITLTGTEPFWGLEIGAQRDGEHEARFSQLDEIDGREFVVTRFAGNNGLGFSGELDGKPVQIALTPGDCSDGMSDRSYPLAATVAVGDAVLLGCAYTSEEPLPGPASP